MKNIDSVVQSMKNILIDFEVSNKEIDNCCDMFERVLKGLFTMDDAFSFIDHGAFKETYSLTDDLVIKFCSIDNNTNDEMYILDVATKAGLNDIFLPTRQIDVSDFAQHCFLSHIAQDYGRGYSYNSYYKDLNPEYHADTVLIQKKIKNTYEESHGYVAHWVSDYALHPVSDSLTNRIVEYSYIRDTMNMEAIDWLQSLMDNFGSEYFYSVGKFIKKHHIHDLHTSNVGYYTKGDKILPCIIDWLS